MVEKVQCNGANEKCMGCSHSKPHIELISCFSTKCSKNFEYRCVNIKELRKAKLKEIYERTM